MEKTEKMIRCAIYIRVSTAEQRIHGKSLQAQQEYLTEYAIKNNMVIVGVYADEGQTARKELKKRKAIHALLSDVKEDKIDMILFWKMDRWFRNVSDFYKVQDILDAYNVKWIAVAEPNMNLETRDGRLNLNIMLSIGQNEVDTTSERIRFTVDNMISNGRLVWGNKNLPLGYKIEDINGEKKIVKNESEEPIVNEVYNYFLTYQNKRGTVIHIQKMFGIDFSYVLLRTMLTSEFYIGKYRNNTNYCPAYLTIDQWEKVQEISKRNIRSNRSNRIYLFSSLMRCPHCGQMLVGTGCNSIINRKTKEKRTYCYYRCNRALIDYCCDYTYKISQNLIEDYLLKNLSVLFEDFYLREVAVSEKKSKNNPARTKEQIEQEMERLNMMFQKDRISWEYYNEQYEALEKEKRSLVVIKKDTRDYSHITKLLQSDFITMYQELDQTGRQSFWHGIIKQIYIDDNKKITAVDFL